MARNKRTPYINAAPMADIAFLLLIFFLVTTTVASDKGIALLLPPKPDPNQPPPEVKENDRNIFKILVNSSDNILVENEPLTDVSKIKDKVKDFVLNFGKNTPENEQLLSTLAASQVNYINGKLRKPDSSDGPEKAIVSFKTDRGTSYKTYLSILDEIMAAYDEIYAERVGLTTEQFLALDHRDPQQEAVYNRGKEGIPKAVSIAEPSKVGK
jgi:biopolymer transport protein ExbD